MLYSSPLRLYLPLNMGIEVMFYSSPLRLYLPLNMGIEVMLYSLPLRLYLPLNMGTEVMLSISEGRQIQFAFRKVKHHTTALD